MVGWSSHLLLWDRSRLDLAGEVWQDTCGLSPSLGAGAQACPCMVMAEVQESMLPCARSLGLGLELVPSYFHGILLTEVSGQVWSQTGKVLPMHLARVKIQGGVKNWAIGASATVPHFINAETQAERGSDFLSLHLLDKARHLSI